MCCRRRAQGGGVCYAGWRFCRRLNWKWRARSLNEKKLAEFARARMAERAEGQMAHLKLAGKVLAKFKEMRESAPEVPAGVLLERLSPADRGSVLLTLLAGSAEKGERQTLWAVAGPNLLRIDARLNPAKVETIALPTNLGPLRSVQGGKIRGAKRSAGWGARRGDRYLGGSTGSNFALYRFHDSVGTWV